MHLPLTFEVAPEPLMLVRPRGLAPERAAQQAQAEVRPTAETERSLP
jgi:hypothetical protein